MAVTVVRNQYGQAPFEWWMQRDPVTGVPFASIAPGPPQPSITGPRWKPVFPDFGRYTADGRGKLNVMWHFLPFIKREGLKNWGVPDTYADDFISIQESVIMRYWPYFVRQMSVPVSRHFFVLDLDPKTGSLLSTKTLRARDIYTNVPEWDGSGEFDPPKTEKLYWTWKKAVDDLHQFIDPQVQTIQNRIKEEAEKKNAFIKQIASVITTAVLTVLTAGLLSNLKTELFPGNDKVKVDEKKPITNDVVPVENGTVSAPSIADPETQKDILATLDEAADLDKKGRDNMDWWEEVRKAGTKALSSVGESAGEYLGNLATKAPDWLGLGDSAGTDVPGDIAPTNTTGGGDKGVSPPEPKNVWQTIKAGLLGGFLKSPTGKNLQAEAQETAINSKIVSIVKSPVFLVFFVGLVFFALLKIKR